MSGADDVRTALLAFRSKDGHFGVCSHRQWVGNWEQGHTPGVDCPADYPCGGTNGPMPAAGGGNRQPERGRGAGCSKRCRDANRALGFLGARQITLGEAEDRVAS